MHDARRSAPAADDDEVAVPGRELLERREQLLALGAARRAPRTRCSASRAGRSSPRAPPPRAPWPRRPARAPASSSRRAAAPGSNSGRGRPSAPSSSSAARRSRRRPGRAAARPGRAARRRRARAPSPRCSESSGARATHLLTHRALREPPERDELAARADRLRQRAELVGDEHDHRVRRRLLEVLEQRVGGVLVQQVRAEDEVDAPVGLERAHVQVAAQLADRRRCGSGRRAARARRGRGARAARPAGVAEQLRGERERRRALADARRPVEEVRVRRPLRERRPASRRFASSCSGTLSKLVDAPPPRSRRRARVPSIRTMIRCGKALGELAVARVDASRGRRRPRARSGRRARPTRRGGLLGVDEQQERAVRERGRAIACRFSSSTRSTPSPRAMPW